MKLTNVKPVDLAMALDIVQEAGLVSQPPDFDHRSTCCYLRRAPRAVMEVLLKHLPHVKVRFLTMGGTGKNKPTRPVFHLSVLYHALKALGVEIQFYNGGYPNMGNIRTLNTVAKKYWRVVS